MSAADGRAARARVRRGAHGEFAPAGDRADPLDVLERQGSTRLEALLPLRYERMAASPFAFFRGAAAVMAADLAATPATGLRVQLCGDAHLANFGGFAAPDRQLVFDINDFDETLPGPWEWDVKRLVASIAIAGRDARLRRRQRRDAVARGGRAATARRCATSPAIGQPRRLVRAARRRRADREHGGARELPEEQARAFDRNRREGRTARQPARAREADRARRRRSCGSSATRR